MRPTVADDFIQRLVETESGSVRAVRGHRLDDIRDRQNPCFQAYLGAFQMLRIAGAVQASWCCRTISAIGQGNSIPLMMS